MSEKWTRDLIPCMDPGHGWNPRDTLQDCLNLPLTRSTKGGRYKNPMGLKGNPQMLQARTSVLGVAAVP